MIGPSQPRSKPKARRGAGLAGVFGTRIASTSLAVGSLLLAACGAGEGTAPAAAGVSPASASAASAASQPGAGASGPAAAPVSVTLVTARPRDFTITLEASGTVSALSSVEIKPQVSAQVLAVQVKEGQFVKAGQPLFLLDARADAANLKKAEAQLLKDEATLADARRQLARSQELLGQAFISQGAVDTARATMEGQQALVAADRAVIDAVQVQLSYARISAPSAGRVGQIMVYPGSSVAPGGAAMLTLTQIDPVAVAFTLPQRHLPDARAALRGAGQVTAQLPDNQGSRQGRLVFVDSVVDAASGTLKAKAQFGNADQALWPGAYVTVKMALQTLPQAIVLPQASLVQGARGQSVFVAGPGNVAQQRPIKVLTSAGSEAVVSGVQPGERVVLDGRQNLRPGSKLLERPADAPVRAASGARSAASGARSAAIAASGPAGRTP